MSIRIEHPHTLAEDQLKNLAEELVAKLQSKYNLTPSWNGNVVTFSGSGVNGTLTLGSDNVVVEVKLGMLMSAFAGPIRQELEKTLQEKLG